MKSIAASLLLCASASSGSACTLAFVPQFRIPDGRIAALELTLRHAAIASLKTVPAGWKIVIDNDPSWMTSVSGHGIVGAAFLAPALVPDLFSLRPEPGYSCSALAGIASAKLKLQIYHADQMRGLIVGSSSLLFAEEPSR